MSLRDELEKTVEAWSKLGVPALMERFVLRNGKAMPGASASAPPAHPRNVL